MVTQLERKDIVHVEEERTLGAKRLVLVPIGLWFVAAVVAGKADIFATPNRPPLTVGLFALVPMVGFVVAYVMSPLLRRALATIPLWKLTIAHVWRFVGLGFVLAAISGTLPRQFGYPEGIGDMIAAAAAIPLAFLLARRPSTPRLGLYYRAWNVFGLFDLVSAITMGILYSPSTFGVLLEDVSTLPLTRWPVSLIPTFFVPLFILTHLLGLHRAAELSTGRAGSSHEAGMRVELEASGKAHVLRQAP